MMPLRRCLNEGVILRLAGVRLRKGSPLNRDEVVAEIEGPPTAEELATACREMRVLLEWDGIVQDHRGNPRDLEAIGRLLEALPTAWLLHGEGLIPESGTEMLNITSAASGSLRAAQPRGAKKAEQPKTTVGRKQQRESEKIQLLPFIRQHHRFDDSKIADELNLVPPTWKDVHEEFGWSQSKVSRVFQHLIPGGMAAYKRLCKTAPSLHGFLVKTEDGGSTLEAICDKPPHPYGREKRRSEKHMT